MKRTLESWQLLGKKWLQYYEKIWAFQNTLFYEHSLPIRSMQYRLLSNSNLIVI